MKAKKEKVPNLKPEDVRCKMPGCRGTLWRVDPLGVESFGYIHLKCDQGCGTWAVRTGPGREA
jgi:hypothetical protein